MIKTLPATLMKKILHLLSHYNANFSSLFELNCQNMLGFAKRNICRGYRCAAMANKFNSLFQVSSHRILGECYKWFAIIAKCVYSNEQISSLRLWISTQAGELRYKFKLWFWMLLVLHVLSSWSKWSIWSNQELHLMVLETIRSPPVQRYEILSSLLSLILNFTQFNNSFWETFQQNCLV